MERLTANVPQPDRRPVTPAATLPLHPLKQIRRALGTRAGGRFIQAILTVSQPGDQYEQEADRVADQVMRMPDQTAPSTVRPDELPQISQLQRKCAQCGEEEVQRQPMEEEEEETLQVKGATGQTPQITQDMQAQINSLRGGGQALPESVLEFFEPRFGRDLSRVQIHADARAAAFATSIGALAYTVGQDVFFGQGQYHPDTFQGQELLAHELVHTIQQSNVVGDVASRRILQLNQQVTRTDQGSSGVVPAPSSLLQHKCACGTHTMAGGECQECGKERNSLQREAINQSANGAGVSQSGIPVKRRKLAIGASKDPLEQEADRVADQVLAMPAHSEVSGAQPHIQRFAWQPTGQSETVPASVDRVLASPGMPLEPALRQDMEQRFGQDFSRVRVHTDASAARQLNAAAFTAGSDIVFAAGAYRPEIPRGKQLIAHELAHVLQHRTNTARADAPLFSRQEHAAERQADSIVQQMALGRPVNGLTPVAPSSLLSLAPDTWYRGEAEGVPVAKDERVIHDLGDGIYFSDRADVAEEYAEMRSPKNPAARRILMGQVDPKTLGRVLNLTEDPEFMEYFNHVKASLKNVSGEPYRNMFKGHLNRKGLKLDNFDTIIGPEGIRGGKQMCIRNPEIATKIGAKLVPLKPPSSGRGPGSTGGGEPGGEERGTVRRPEPKGGGGAGGVAKAVEQGEIEAEKGAPPRRPRVAGTAQSQGPIVSGRQVATSVVLNIGAGIALGIFQSQFKEKVKRDLASLPQPKIDKRGAAEFLKDPKVKDSMGLLDLFSKNLKPLGQELQDSQQLLITQVNLELVGLALASEKTPAALEMKLQRFSEIGHELSDYEEVLLTIRDNLEVILEREDKARETKKAADDLREFLKNGFVINWLFHQGFTVEEISRMDSNLLHLSVSIDIAFRDAHALKDTVDKLLEGERKLAKGVNNIWWTEFGRRLQLPLKERQ